jgi:Cu/Ag efflux pump CusA
VGDEDRQWFEERLEFIQIVVVALHLRSHPVLVFVCFIIFLIFIDCSGAVFARRNYPVALIGGYCMHAGSGQWYGVVQLVSWLS